MSKIITFANFKGGVGKTTASVMFSYLMSSQGKKVLLIDLDPQKNATDIIFKTFDINVDNYNSVFDGIIAKDLSESIYEVAPNLHIIPSGLDLVGFSQHLFSVTRDKRKQPFMLDSLLPDIKTDYDFIFIDVPPTISEITNNAVVASDYVMIILQTHEQSFSASVDFIRYLQDMQKFNPDIDLLGVIAYMIDPRGKVDNEILDEAREAFGDVLFENKIMTRQRVKSFGKYGITNKDMHDSQVIEMFENVVKEFNERVK